MENLWKWHDMWCMTWCDAMTTWQVIYAIENRGYNYRSILSREKVLTIHFDWMKCEIDFVVVVCLPTSSTVILRSLLMSQAPKIPATSWALPSEIVEKKHCQCHDHNLDSSTILSCVSSGGCCNWLSLQPYRWENFEGFPRCLPAGWWISTIIHLYCGELDNW